MLTLILLVVLGGGAGLLAVSLSDHRPPWAARRGRHDVPSLRPSPTGDTSPAPLAVRPAIPVRRYQRTGSAPPARTAIEGPYGEVAVAPWWRRLVSLALVVVITVLVGVGIAIIVGATMAAMAELLDGAIG